MDRATGTESEQQLNKKEINTNKCNPREHIADDTVAYENYIPEHLALFGLPPEHDTFFMTVSKEVLVNGVYETREQKVTFLAPTKQKARETFKFEFSPKFKLLRASKQDPQEHAPDDTVLVEKEENLAIEHCAVSSALEYDQNILNPRKVKQEIRFMKAKEAKDLLENDVHDFEVVVIETPDKLDQDVSDSQDSDFEFIDMETTIKCDHTQEGHFGTWK